MSNDKKEDSSWSRKDINILEYLWATSIFSTKNSKNIPFLLKKVDLFEDFSEVELNDLIEFIHFRNYSPNEKIFSKGESGIGFYILLSGRVLICNDEENEDKGVDIIPSMYFGERNLLSSKSKRQISATAKDSSVLAAILSPDLDNLIEKKPRIAAKLILSLAKFSLRRLDEIESALGNSGNSRNG